MSGGGSGDDLQFLTTQEMDEEYNETEDVSGTGGHHTTSTTTTTPKSIFETEEPTNRWTAPLRKLSLFRESRHPGVACFHLLFKTLAVFVYEFNNLFDIGFVLVCVLCIILLAFDFWTVKNVSGRLLVGLRWWNYVKEDGATEWVFESIEDTSEISPTDRRLFWVGLYAPAVVWGVLLLVALVNLSFQWLIVIIAALSLSSANIIGYTKCSKEATARLHKFAEGGVAQNLVGAIGVSNIISGIGSIMQGQQGGAAAGGGGKPGSAAGGGSGPTTMSV